VQSLRDARDAVGCSCHDTGGDGCICSKETHCPCFDNQVGGALMRTWSVFVVDKRTLNAVGVLYRNVQVRPDTVSESIQRLKAIFISASCIRFGAFFPLFF
jgi:hypothetical protein